MTAHIKGHSQNEQKTNIYKEAWPELCQAQVKEGLAKIKIFLHLIEH